MLYQRSPIYFVTACAAQRRELLANFAVHGAFRAFADLGPSCGAWVGAYVFMPDHLHLFVAIDGEQLSLSDWMKSLKGTLSSDCARMARLRRIGRKAFSITCSAAVTHIRKNGTT
jgi:REP element-mobilizing transposase RayT